MIISNKNCPGGRPALTLFFLMIGVTAAMILNGCESEPVEVEKYEPQPVLTALITTGSPMQEVYLEWVWKDIETEYIEENTGVHDAVMIIYDIPDSNHVLHLQEDANHPGRYVPVPGESLTPVGGVRYRLEATAPGGVELWAETTAPEEFDIWSNRQEINDLLGETPQAYGWDGASPILPPPFPAFNREDEFIRVGWTISQATEGFILNIVALTDTADLEPLDPDWDPNDPDDELEPGQKGRVSWTVAPTYQEAMDVAWIFYNWVGPQRLDIMAASAEYFRYVFTGGLEQGPPGTVRRPQSNVHGGLGVFGATCIHSFYITMLKNGPNITLPTVPENYTDHDFGEVAAGDSTEWILKVFNTGSEALEIHEIAMSDQVFSLTENAPWSLPSGTVREFVISFSPVQAGDYEALVIIRSNDPMEPEKAVRLSGSGALPATPVNMKEQP